MQKDLPSVVVLISGRGSNLSAILAHAQSSGEFKVSAVISNRPGALGLELAQSYGVPTEVLDHKQFGSREAFDRALAERIDAHTPQLVVLAGFMRILTEGFVQHFAGRLVNIHPSLLPAFPGLNTHQQALDAGVRVHGVTVHLVTPQLDHGPVLDQAVVPVWPDDTADSLAERVLALEHQIYPRAIAAWLRGDLRLVGQQVEGARRPALIHSLPPAPPEH